MMSSRLSLKEKLLGGSARSSNVKKNIIGSIFIKGISIGIQLLLVPLTLGYLSTELYGIWLTVSSIVFWFTFFDVGFSLGLKNKLAEAVAKKDYARGKQLISTTYIVLMLIFIPLGVILEAIIPIVDWSSFLNVADTYNAVLTNVMRVLVISFVFQMIFNTIGAVVAAFQQVALSSAFPIIGNAISLVVIWFLTHYTEPSLMNLALSVSFIPVIVLFSSSVILFNGSLRKVRPSISSFNKSIIRDIFSLGIKFFIIQIQIIVIQQSTNILISNVSNPDYVTYYNIAYRYIGTALMIFTLILGPMWPAFTEAYAKKDYMWMNNVYQKLSRLYLLILAMMWSMLVVSPYAYHIWIGNEAIIPFGITFAMTIYFTVASWNSLQVNLINGIGAVKMQSYVTLAGMIIHIPLSLFLGKYIGIGAYGIIVSMTFITLIYATMFTIQIRKILKQKAVGVWIS